MTVCSVQGPRSIRSLPSTFANAGAHREAVRCLQYVKRLDPCLGVWRLSRDALHELELKAHVSFPLCCTELVTCSALYSTNLHRRPKLNTPGRRVTKCLLGGHRTSSLRLASAVQSCS